MYPARSCSSLRPRVAVLPGVVHTRLGTNRGATHMHIKKLHPQKKGVRHLFRSLSRSHLLLLLLDSYERKMLCDNHQPYRMLGAVLFFTLLQDSNPELAIALINYRLRYPFGCTIFLLITTHFARWEIGIGRLHRKKVLFTLYL